MRASRLRWLIPTMVLVAIVLIPLAAWGQTPVPGEEPEVVRPWTWWMSIPIALAALGLAGLIALLFVRVSSRFHAGEEPPKIPERPRAYAGVNAPAYPAPAGQPAPAPAAQSAPAAEPEAAAAEPETVEAEAQPEAAEPEKTEPEAEEAPQEAEAGKPAAEEEKPAEAPDSGDDVYERVLKEQLDKGVSPKVAEGRAKAAAHRARQSG